MRDVCYCGYSDDDELLCIKGTVHLLHWSGLYVGQKCNCVCHGNVIALRPKEPVEIRRGSGERMMVAA